MDDPVRLIQSGELPQLDRDLAAIGGLPPADYDATAGLARFQAALAGKAASAGAAAPAAGGGGWLKLVTIVGVAVVGGAIAIGLAGTPTDSAAPPQTAEASTAAEGASAPLPTPPPLRVPAAITMDPPRSESVPIVEEPMATAKAKPRARAKAAPENTASTSAADVTEKDDADAREIAMTREMSKLARTNPSRCLELAEQARRDFGEGLLGIERNAYEIIALFGAGRTETARARASAYLERHPNGPQVDRIRALAQE